MRYGVKSVMFVSQHVLLHSVSLCLPVCIVLLSVIYLFNLMYNLWPWGLMLTEILNISR